MAHGSKKFIVRYDGRVKRSNDRTGLDYMGELKWWEPAVTMRRWSGRKLGVFCPQCRGVQKVVEDFDWVAYDVAMATIRDEFLERYGALAGENRPSYWTFRCAHPKFVVAPPILDQRSYLCFRCEAKYDAKCRAERRAYRPWTWDRHSRYTWVRRQEYRDYRNKVKAAMREERYEAIGPVRHGWLD